MRDIIPENGVRLFKARPAILYNSRDTFPVLIFVRAILGSAGCRPGT
jgi:hypothetical protein